MSGYCKDCGNHPCVCDEIENYKKGFSMIDFIKTKMLWVLLILFIASVAGNVYFIIGKGVNFTTNNTSESVSNSYSNASSSSIAINVNGGNYWGNSKVVYDFQKFSTFEEAMIFINSQSEGNLYNVQVLVDNQYTREGYPRNFIVMYRTTDDMKKTGSVTKKIVNGVEVK